MHRQTKPKRAQHTPTAPSRNRQPDGRTLTHAVQRALVDPTSARPETILQLQRLYGNRFVSRLYSQSQSQSTDQAATPHQTPAPSAGHAAVVQRTVDLEELKRALGDKQRPESIYRGDKEHARKRNREELIMVHEVLTQRWPADYFPEGSLMYLGEDYIETLVSRLNETSPITYADILREAMKIEEEEDFENDVLANPEVTPTTNIERFLALLKMRRGSYNWAGGTSTAFSEWVNSQEPLANPLPKSATINCWEAVLACAAEAGLVKVSQLKGAYDQKDQTHAVFELITSKGVQVIEHTKDQEDRSNGMAVGDIVMLDGVDGKMHHVVAVVKADPEDYAQVQVLSLWNEVGGGGFTRAALNVFLNENKEIRYASL